MKLQVSRFANRGMVKALGLSVTALVAVLGLTGAASAQGVIRAVQIDMSGIPSGAAETRADLQACLARSIPQAFAGRINPAQRNAPVLVVRPTSVWLANVAASSVREEFGGSMGTTSLDSLEGVGILGGQSIPLTVSANPDFGTIGLPAYNARVRTDALCTSFVYWLARKI
jgi:hypothetical protein